MPRRRYSSLRYGELRLGEYFNNYVNWVRRLRLPRPGVRSSRTTLSASIRPFGLSFDTQALVTRPETIGILESLITSSNQCELETPARAGAKRLRGFLPARVAVEYGDNTYVVVQSEITGILYKRYDGLVRYSAPYGRATANDLEFEARELIRQDFMELRANDKVKRITFRGEQRLEYV